MTDSTSVIEISAGVLEDIEREDDREGWSDGPDAAFVLPAAERAAFYTLVAYQMPDDEDDSCPVCTRWSCVCQPAT